MKLRKEFKRRLINLRYSIDYALEKDCVIGNLLPDLFQAFMYLWPNTSKAEFNNTKHKI